MRSVAAALESAGQGLEHYLVIWARAGQPAAELRIGYTSEDDTGIFSQLATIGPLQGPRHQHNAHRPGRARVRARCLAFAAVIGLLGGIGKRRRSRQLVPISAGCGLLTVGYLVTASVLAPMLGHVLMHTAAILHGAELPPLTRPVTVPRLEAALRSDAHEPSAGRHRPPLHGR